MPVQPASGPRDEVGGDHRQREPGLVHVELSGGEPSQAGVLGVPDAVLDAGVGPVTCFEEGQLTGLGVGGEGLVAPAVAFLEQRQLRTGMGPLPADDDGRVDEAGPLGDVSALTHTTGGVQCRGPDLRRDQVDAVAELLGDREPDGVVDAAAPDLALLGESAEQAAGGACTVAVDQQRASVGGRDLRDRVGEDLDVVGGGVRPGVACPELAGEELLRVVAPHPERVVPEGPLERGGRVLLPGVRDHNRRVDVEHDDAAGPGQTRVRRDRAEPAVVRRLHLCPDLVGHVFHRVQDCRRGRASGRCGGDGSVPRRATER